MQLADFVHGLRHDDLPDGLAEKMHVHLVDTVAAGLGGATMDIAESIRAHSDRTGDASSKAALWGGGRSDARLAALANGTAAHVLEVDDTGGCDHSGAVVVPALLALADSAAPQVTLEQLLTAMTAGYEVARRVQFFLGGYPHLNGLGWHSTAVCGPIGAAAGAAKLLGLGPEGIADAMGLATSMMAGTWSFKSGGGDNKALHSGLPAAHGVESALLARAGVAGTRMAFDDTWGGIGALYAGNAVDPAALVAGLGERWVAYDASIKPFPSCASSHRMIQLAQDQLSRAGFAVDDVESVEIQVGPLVADMCGEQRATELASLKQRQLSIPYGVATVLVRGTMAFDSLAADPDPASPVLGLLERTRISIDESITGGHGEGHIIVRYRGAHHRFSTDDVADPRNNITTMTDVLRKAGQVLASVGASDRMTTLRKAADLERTDPVAGLVECAGDVRG